jgi:hypothetical protein
MKARGHFEVSGYSDAQLEEGLVLLVRSGRQTEAQIVAHLAEVEARRLHLRAGASSMFVYCQVRLGLSEMEAFHRIAAARLSRRYPQILGMLEAGQLHLSGICAIRNFITDENHADLLNEIAGQSKRQIELLLARRFPRADIGAALTQLPKLEPLAEDRFLLQLTISQSLKEKLEQAQELMSHANPSGDWALVIERAMDLLLTKLAARRFGVVSAPRQAQASPATAAPVTSNEPVAHSEAESAHAAADSQKPVTRPRQHIPNAVRRAVVERDGLSCSFVAADGTRCGARAFIQLHHELAWAAGGENTFENLRPLCGAHNRLLAEDAADILDRARTKPP